MGKDTGWKEYFSDNERYADIINGFCKDSKLHPVITFVLYSGKEEWDGSTSLHEMLDFTDIPETLREMIPDYKIHVIEIRRLESTEVFQTDVRQVFDFIRCPEKIHYVRP